MPDRNDICTGCLWWQTWSCDGDKKFPCHTYKGFVDSDFDNLLAAYEEDIDTACAPVREQWKYIFEDYYK